MSLEGVFASIAAWLFLNQVLGLKSTKNLKKGLLLKLGDMEE